MLAIIAFAVSFLAAGYLAYQWYKPRIRRLKTKWAIAHIQSLGLVAVRIETRAGTDYLHCPDGTFRKIGR